MPDRRAFLTAAAAFTAGAVAFDATDAEAATTQVVSVLNGNKAPAKTLGIVGDFYIDDRTHAIYGPKRKTGWGKATSLIGTRGSAGNPGATGATGPSGSAGANGSTGAQGATGPQGGTGPQGPQGYSVLNGGGPPAASLGEDNDFYIDTATTQLYGPKEGGAWGSPVSLTASTAISDAADAVSRLVPAGTPVSLALARAKSNRRQSRYQATANTSLATWSLSTSSSLSGATVTPPVTNGSTNAQDAPFRFEGASVQPPNSTANFVMPVFAGGQQPVPWRVSFDFYGSEFEIVLWGGNYEVQVYVNDTPILASPANMANDQATYYGLVNLKTAAHYRIGIDLSGGVGGYSAYFGGINALHTFDIRPPADSNPLRMIIVGDSYSIGKGGGNLSTSPNEYSINGYVPQLSRLIGIPDVWCLGINGTGYVANEGGQASPYSARLSDLVAATPDIVIVQGSINDATDTNTTPSAVQSAAESFLGDVTDQLPNAALLATGPLYARAYYSPVTAIASALQGAASSAGVPFIDATSWASGTGYYGATNGTGTSDFYLNGDNVHPTPAGHLMLANRLASAIDAQLGLTI